MALTAAKVRDLEDRGFLRLFDEHGGLWEAKAREAYAYAEALVGPTGEPVRPDDVLELLVPALVLSKEFRSFLDDNRLTYFHEGRFKQLSQTGGEVIQELLA